MTVRQTPEVTFYCQSAGGATVGLRERMDVDERPIPSDEQIGLIACVSVHSNASCSAHAVALTVLRWTHVISLTMA